MASYPTRSDVADMDAGLEAIVAADEEVRARVLFAEKRQAREIDAARAQRDRALAERRDAMQAALDAEIASIRESGERERAAARASHEAYLATLQATGERELERAAELFARIVREGASS